MYPLGHIFKGKQPGAKEQEYPIHSFGTKLTAVWPLAWEMRAKKGEATTSKSVGAAKKLESKTDNQKWELLFPLF